VGVLDSWHRERTSVDEPVQDEQDRSGDDCIGEQDRAGLAGATSVEVNRVAQEQIGVAGQQERAEVSPEFGRNDVE
jgi:hypothetical protein